MSERTVCELSVLNNIRPAFLRLSFSKSSLEVLDSEALAMAGKSMWTNIEYYVLMIACKSKESIFSTDATRLRSSVGSTRVSDFLAETMKEFSCVDK